jgi:hypothetical protein
LHRIPTIQRRMEGTYLSVEMYQWRGTIVGERRQQKFYPTPTFVAPRKVGQKDRMPHGGHLGWAAELIIERNLPLIITPNKPQKNQINRPRSLSYNWRKWNVYGHRCHRRIGYDNAPSNRWSGHNYIIQSAQMTFPIHQRQISNQPTWGNTMRKIMGNKPQVSSAINIQSSANFLEWPSAPGSDCWCFCN